MGIALRPALAGRKAVKIITKRNRWYSPEQIVRTIQDADRMLAEGGDVASVLKVLNATETTSYRRSNHYGGFKAQHSKKLKQVEEQNLALKKLLAEAELDTAAVKELAEENF